MNKSSLTSMLVRYITLCALLVSAALVKAETKIGTIGSADNRNSVYEFVQINVTADFLEPKQGKLTLKCTGCKHSRINYDANTEVISPEGQLISSDLLPNFSKYVALVSVNNASQSAETIRLYGKR